MVGTSNLGSWNGHWFIQDSPMGIARGSSADLFRRSTARISPGAHHCRSSSVSSPAWDEIKAKQLTMWLGISQVSRAIMVNPQLPMLDLWWLFHVIPLWQHFTTSLAFHSPCTTQLPNPAEKTAPTWWSSSFTFWQIVIILKLETCCHFGNYFELSGDDFVNHLELRQFLVICQIPTWTALPFSRSRYITLVIWNTPDIYGISRAM